MPTLSQFIRQSAGFSKAFLRSADGAFLRVVWDDYRFEETSPGIGVPQWWYSGWLPVLCGLTTARALQLWVRLRRASTQPESRP